MNSTPCDTQNAIGRFKFSSGLSSSKFDGSAMIALFTPSKMLDLGGDQRLVSYIVKNV